MIGNKKTRGAVSVFLVMILVPCIVVTSLFVDLGRVQMSKSLATSASDLALNSLLTNYDADLNEWYGMVASCQNIEEFYEVSAQYFLRTISSQGLSEDEIILVSDYYAAATNDDTIYDLLKVESQTAPSVMISEVENANLANATIIKDQIVEFMKYRAPIEITTGLIGMFTNSDGTQNEAAGALLDSEVNEPLVEEKQQFFEAEGELLTKAFYTYWAIRDYYDDAKTIGLNNAKLIEYQNKINGYKAAYEEINNHVVKNLYNTSGLTTYTRPTTNVYAYSYSAADVCSTTEVDEDDVTHYIINGARVESLIYGLGVEVGNLRTAVSQFESATSSLMNTTTGTTDDTANEIQWWVQMDGVVRNNSISTAADNMVKAFAKVDAIEKCELADDVAADWETRATAAMTDANNMVSSYLTSTSSGNAYCNAVSKLESVSSNNINKISANNLYVTVDGSSVTVSSAPNKIASELSALRAELQARVNELNIAINGNGDDIVSLTTLTALASTYQTEFTEWKNLANTMHINDGDNAMAEADADETNGKVLESKIDAASVTELKTRLSNIKSQLENVIAAIDSIKYGNKKVTEITSIDTVKTQAGTKLSSVPLMNGDLNSTAGSTFTSLFKPTTSQILTLSNTTGNSHNPDIDPSESNTVDTPDLYVYFHKQWWDTIRNQVKSVEEEEKQVKDDVANYESDMLLQASKYRGGGTDITKDFSQGNGYSANIVSLISSIAGLISDLINANFDGIRDDIYVTTYTMEMFSYATYDYEAKYKELLSEEEQGKLTPSNIGIYDSEAIQGAADKEKTWLSEDFRDSYNKSLTNKMINKTNNQAYLAEVEYILYGKSTNADNLKAAFGDIYSFRFALNTVSGFQHFWSSPDDPTAIAIEMIAGAISTACCGVVPAPVFKAVLIPILAALETCQDNRRLAAGMPVEIYKMEPEDWWIRLPAFSTDNSFSSFFTSLKDASGNEEGKNKNSGLFYSDYLTIFVYLGLSGGGTVEEDMYRRIGEVIQSNMCMHDGIKDYSKTSADGSTTSLYTLKNSRVYFKLEATLRTEPLMIAMPVFNEYDNNMDTQTDWCTYKISTVRGYS